MHDVHRQILSNIESLPPMPQTVAEVMRMSRTQDFSPADLATVVCRDAVLTSNVLRLCNSGFYGLSQEVTSIHKAVLLLGFDMVKNLVFSSFVHGVIREDLPGYAQTAESLWEHSLGGATAALVLAERSVPELADAAYTAGLIHDIGKVVLANFVSKAYLQVVELVRRKRMSFREAEQETLGTSHAEVGALVADHWNLAPVLQDVILHHHEPSTAQVEPRLSAVVGLADGVCSILGVGAGLDATDSQLDDWSLELLGLDPGRFQEALDETMRRLLELQGRDLT
jgi:putative nucleotidyltransferase with HDIG domain